jgi:CBS domain-containing protein
MPLRLEQQSMQARDLMTKDVVAVSPGAPARKIAKVLLDHRISAVPVVDEGGAVLGMVSEGDLLGHRKDQDARDRKRSWWLALLTEGEPLNPEFIAELRSNELTARELMRSPAITVNESACDTEVASILDKWGIKRVPVTRDGRIVGIVSRADLVRGLAGLWNSTDGVPPRG